MDVRHALAWGGFYGISAATAFWLSRAEPSWQTGLAGGLLIVSFPALSGAACMACGPIFRRFVIGSAVASVAFLSCPMPIRYRTYVDVYEGASPTRTYFYRLAEYLAVNWVIWVAATGAGVICVACTYVLSHVRARGRPPAPSTRLDVRDALASGRGPGVFYFRLLFVLIASYSVGLMLWVARPSLATAVLEVFITLTLPGLLLVLGPAMTGWRRIFVTAMAISSVVSVVIFGTTRRLVLIVVLVSGAVVELRTGLWESFPFEFPILLCFWAFVPCVGVLGGLFYHLNDRRSRGTGAGQWRLAPKGKR